jgi:Protein of unknown function (DUF4230)
MESIPNFKPLRKVVLPPALPRFRASTLLMAVALLLGGYGFYQIQAQWRLPALTSVEIRALVNQGLQSKSELTTVQRSATATVVIRQPRTWGNFSFGDTNLVYQGVGEVQAGIDLKKLEAQQVNRAEGRIQILLPPPQITHVWLDVHKSSVLANYKRWFGPDVELELQQSAQREALKQITANACQQDLLTTTNANAKQLVEKILHTAGYQEVVVNTQAGTCLSNPST